jgi:hypothetical protein
VTMITSLRESCRLLERRSAASIHSAIVMAAKRSVKLPRDAGAVVFWFFLA